MNVEEISDDTFVNKKGSTKSMDDECVFKQASEKQVFQQGMYFTYTKQIQSYIVLLRGSQTRALNESRTSRWISLFTKGNVQDFH